MLITDRRRSGGTQRGFGRKTEETEDSTLHLCYNGNVNTKIAISIYCECQSVEIEEYIFHFSRLAFIRIAWFCMRYFHIVACSYVIMFFCQILLNR